MEDRSPTAGVVVPGDPGTGAVFDAAVAGCGSGWWALVCDRDDDALAVTCGTLDRTAMFASLTGDGPWWGGARWEVSAGRVAVELVDPPRSGASRLVATLVGCRAGELLGWCAGASHAQAEVLLAVSPETLAAAAPIVGLGPAPVPPPRFVGDLAPVHRITEVAAALDEAGWGALGADAVEVAAAFAAGVDTTVAGWAERLRDRVAAVCDAAAAAGVAPADVVELVDVGGLGPDEVGALVGVAFAA